MICVLLNREDADGLKLFRLLQNAGRRDIKLISAEELVYAPSFRCGFQNGEAFFSLQLANGFEFSNQTVTSVINRIQQLPYEHVQQFKAEDKAYVRTELEATFVFLFSILPNNVFNKSTPAGFGGRRRSLIEWQLLATESGFKTGEILYENKQLQTTVLLNKPVQSILFFGGSCYGSATVNFPQAVSFSTKLGEFSGEKILEIWFWEDDGEIFFASAGTHPSSKNFDNNFINYLNSLL